MSATKNVAKILTAAIAWTFAALVGPAHADAGGNAGYQPVHPLGFEIPAPGTSGPLPSTAAGDDAAGPKGVSPLGFEIPAPGARGVQGPVRSDLVADTWAELRQRLGGIGGWGTP